MKGRLILANGREFPGTISGVAEPALGEVVFTTGMTGYWETITDPTYAGQMITMTYPIQGNYGIPEHSEASGKVWAKGLIVREFCQHPSHYLSEETLDDFLVRNHVTAISEIDTRALTRELRTNGVMNGIIVPDIYSTQEAMQQLALLQVQDYVPEIASRVQHEIFGEGTHVAVLDFGAKKSLIDNLRAMKCRITIFPPNASATDILAVDSQGVLLSDGPGEPEFRFSAIETVRRIAGKVPIVGIGLGHLVVALAMGARTYKLPFGHRGGNHPVKDLARNRVWMTAQNHGYAVDRESLQHTELEITHVQINDDTIEGLRHRNHAIWSLQFHPEGSPGPKDSIATFTDFVKFFQEGKV